jgi:hypothetical protein
MWRLRMTVEVVTARDAAVCGVAGKSQGARMHPCCLNGAGAPVSSFPLVASRGDGAPRGATSWSSATGPLRRDWCGGMSCASFENATRALRRSVLRLLVGDRFIVAGLSARTWSPEGSGCRRLRDAVAESRIARGASPPRRLRWFDRSRDRATEAASPSRTPLDGAP